MAIVLKGARRVVFILLDFVVVLVFVPAPRGLVRRAVPPLLGTGWNKTIVLLSR